MLLSCMRIINNSNRIARSNETFLLSLVRSATISILRGNRRAGIFWPAAKTLQCNDRAEYRFSWPLPLQRTAKPLIPPPPAHSLARNLAAGGIITISGCPVRSLCFFTGEALRGVYAMFSFSRLRFRSGRRFPDKHGARRCRRCARRAGSSRLR